jgi:predicted nucleotidyltransferase
LRADLVAVARADRRITGVALTGSAAAGREDPWSDIDLAFGIGEPSQVEPAVADWTARMYAEHGAVHQVDVRRESWLYRVFLLRNSLQVDLAFAPKAAFGARAPTFRLLFGTAAEIAHVQPPPMEELIGYAWLYALHVRSAIARGKLWQAEYMVSAARDYVLAAACRLHGVPTSEGRGIDQLPDEVSRPLRGALVTRLEAEEIVRAFGVAVDRLLDLARQTDTALAARIEPPLRDLVQSTRVAASSSS